MCNVAVERKTMETGLKGHLKGDSPPENSEQNSCEGERQLFHYELILRTLKMPPCHFPTGLCEKMEVNQKQMKTPLELRQHLCPDYYMFALNPTPRATYQ